MQMQPMIQLIRLTWRSPPSKGPVARKLFVSLKCYSPRLIRRRSYLLKEVISHPRLNFCPSIRHNGVRGIIAWRLPWVMHAYTGYVRRGRWNRPIWVACQAPRLMRSPTFCGIKLNLSLSPPSVLQQRQSLCLPLAIMLFFVPPRFC